MVSSEGYIMMRDVTAPTSPKREGKSIYGKILGIISHDKSLWAHLFTVGGDTRCSIEASVRQDGLVWSPRSWYLRTFPQRNLRHVTRIVTRQPNREFFLIIVINYSFNP
jgi:hypothetical protein